MLTEKHLKYNTEVSKFITNVAINSVVDCKTAFCKQLLQTHQNRFKIGCWPSTEMVQKKNEFDNYSSPVCPLKQIHVPERSILEADPEQWITMPFNVPYWKYQQRIYHLLVLQASQISSKCEIVQNSNYYQSMISIDTAFNMIMYFPVSKAQLSED